MLRHVPLALLLLLSNACAMAPPSAWEKLEDHGAPSFRDTSDCRVEAKRQADLQYPERFRSTNAASGEVRYIDPNWFFAEDWFFKLCMRRKGYAPVPTPQRQISPVS